MGEAKKLRTVEWKRQQLAKSIKDVCKAKIEERRTEKENGTKSAKRK